MRDMTDCARCSKTDIPDAVVGCFSSGAVATLSWLWLWWDCDSMLSLDMDTLLRFEWGVPSVILLCCDLWIMDSI
jgi:hypothetical protein